MGWPFDGRPVPFGLVPEIWQITTTELFMVKKQLNYILAMAIGFMSLLILWFIGTTDDGRLGCGMVRYDIYDYFLGSNYRWVSFAD